MTADEQARVARVMEALGCEQYTHGFLRRDSDGRINFAVGPCFNPWINLNDAWVVVELLRERGIMLPIWPLPDWERATWATGGSPPMYQAGVLRQRNKVDALESADTAPRAIMLAACRALGLEEDADDD